MTTWFLACYFHFRSTFGEHIKSELASFCIKTTLNIAYVELSKSGDVK